ncbi:uncharacterized protein [Heptranchias perlo]|uniref:uncharacterized protein n=1 Tax=Heptranchias perlo TaxID=212740 RepID=UPI003559D5D2
MQAVILTNGSTTDPVRVQTGVKQGCVIAPTLFSIFLAATLHPVTMKLPAGVELTYRTSGKLFNLRCLQARTKTTPTSVIELQYADDASVCAHSEAELQTIVDTFTEACERMGPRLNIQKTKVLSQPVPATQHRPPTIKIHGEPLDSVDHFPYLGSLLSVRADIDDEIQHRLQCASVAFGRLSNRVFEDQTSNPAPSSWSTEQPWSPPSCTHQKHGQCTADTSNRWRDITNIASAKSCKSTDRMGTPT